ncbi:hypothetical protein HYV84_02295 [Candidatus Woesearchaeota archaeon]|nr:hypothetical protein [Candidatus Woesearchaeota archaeon]
MAPSSLRTIRRGGNDILLNAEAMDTPYSSLDDLKRMFDFSSGVCEIPILQNDGSHDFFTLRKVRPPYELTDENHPIYTDRWCGAPRNFFHPELVGIIAVDHLAYIYPAQSEATISKYPYPGVSGDHIILLSA